LPIRPFGLPARRHPGGGAGPAAGDALELRTLEIECEAAPDEGQLGHGADHSDPATYEFEERNRREVEAGGDTAWSSSASGQKVAGR
jgi:hypothetical protein